MDGNGTETHLNNKPFSSRSSNKVWFGSCFSEKQWKPLRRGEKPDKIDYNNDFFIFDNSLGLICALLVRYSYPQGTDVSDSLSMCSYFCVRFSGRKCGVWAHFVYCHCSRAVANPHAVWVRAASIRMRARWEPGTGPWLCAFLEAQLLSHFETSTTRCMLYLSASRRRQHLSWEFQPLRFISRQIQKLVLILALDILQL